MIHVFYKNRHAIGQLMIALMFVSGSIFIFMFSSDGFVSKSKATSCCCSGKAAVTSFASDSSSDYGSDIPMNAEASDGCCGGKDNIPSSSSSNDDNDCKCLGSSCGACDDGKCSSAQKPSSCKTGCAGDFCGESGYGYCSSEYASKYCPKDSDADKDFCDGDSDGCPNED